MLGSKTQQENILELETLYQSIIQYRMQSVSVIEKILRWFRHVERMHKESFVRKIYDMVVNGGHRGHPRHGMIK